MGKYNVVNIKTILSFYQPREKQEKKYIDYLFQFISILQSRSKPLRNDR